MLRFEDPRPVPPLEDVRAKVRELETTVAVQDREFGSDDPRTIDSRFRLADAYLELEMAGHEENMYAPALAELTRATDGRIRTLGAEHPDTLDARRDRARLRFQHEFHRLEPVPGATDRMVDEVRSVADAAARTLGHAHPTTLAAWAVLVWSDPESERADLKERIVRGWEEVLAEREQRLGPDDLETVETMRELASWYPDDRQEDAQRLRDRRFAALERIAATRSRELGPVHPDTVEIRELLVVLSPRDVGERRYAEIVADHLRLLGPDHPRTLHVQVSQLRSWKDLPHLATAETVAEAERLLAHAWTVHGPDNEDVRSLRYGLTSQFLYQGEIDRAYAVKRRYPMDDDSTAPHVHR